MTDEMKNVLVTGSASGIGYYVVKKFHEDGFHVTGMDKAINDSHHKSIRQVRCDLSDKNSVELAFSLIGPIDIAVNCAGIPGIRKPVVDLTAEEVDSAYRGIFIPAFNACKAELDNMKNRKGKIINIASSTADFGSKNMLAYSSAKAAIINLTKVCAVENAPSIMVNSVSPATIDTPMIRKKHLGQLPDYSEAYLTGNCGSVHDVWTAVKFITENNFMTGNNIVMDGGYSALFSLKLKPTK